MLHFLAGIVGIWFAIWCAAGIIGFIGGALITIAGCFLWAWEQCFPPKPRRPYP